MVIWRKAQNRLRLWWFYMCAYNVVKGSRCEAKPLLTDFLDLGLDREEALMLDLFLKNILNVAESKFSTAKHLQDVWGGHENGYVLGGQDSFNASTFTWKPGVNNNASTPTDRAALLVLECQIPEWGRRLQGSVCWSASAAPSGQNLSLKFPVNNSKKGLQLITH